MRPRGETLAVLQFMWCTRVAPTVVVLIVASLGPVWAGAQGRSSSSSESRTDKDAPDSRHLLITRARVWMQTDVARADIRKGPAEPGGFAFMSTISCEYHDEKLGGNSPKFACRVAPDDELKVKYGGANGEVYGEVAATRLLWALGFGADRMYPVKVVCRGCPPVAGAVERLKGAEFILDPAIVE